MARNDRSPQLGPTGSRRGLGAGRSRAELKEIHDFGVKLQGSGTFVVEGQELKALPTYRGNPEVLREDFLPEEAVKDPNFQVWLGVVDGRGRMRTQAEGYLWVRSQIL